jgi:hypothetical protein
MRLLCAHACVIMRVSYDNQLRSSVRLSWVWDYCMRKLELLWKYQWRSTSYPCERVIVKISYDYSEYQVLWEYCMIIVSIRLLHAQAWELLWEYHMTLDFISVWELLWEYCMSIVNMNYCESIVRLSWVSDHRMCLLELLSKYHMTLDFVSVWELLWEYHMFIVSMSYRASFVWLSWVWDYCMRTFVLLWEYHMMLYIISVCDSHYHMCSLELLSKYQMTLDFISVWELLREYHMIIVSMSYCESIVWLSRVSDYLSF